MVIQDYIKFMPIELNKTINYIQNEWVFRRPYVHGNWFEEK